MFEIHSAKNVKFLRNFLVNAKTIYDKIYIVFGKSLKYLQTRQLEKFD